MASTIGIADLPEHLDRRVEVDAWVDVVRDQKAVQFVVLRDASGRVQAVRERRDGDPLNAAISSLTPHSVVRVAGRVVANERVKLGGIELLLEELTVHSRSEAELPITAESSSDKRQSWRFLDLRQPRVRSIFEIQTAVEGAMRERWLADAFLEIHSPKLMGTASESGAEVFRVSYFETEAYLAQSPQFYKQMAIAGGLDRVFEVGPVFRAEPSFTPIHATEFTSVDCELAWIDGAEDVMAYEEAWLRFVLGHVAEQHGEQLRDVFGVTLELPADPFPRIPMRAARELIRSLGGSVPAEKEDLDPAGQRLLCEHVLRTHGSEFVFVTEYPVDVRPFYHMRTAPDADTTRSFDLLWRGVEVTTGAQREHRHDVLVAQALEKGMGLESLGFYLDFFRFGCPPHGGYGFGLARMLMVMLDLASIREVTLLHRAPNRLVP